MIGAVGGMGYIGPSCLVYFLVRQEYGDMVLCYYGR